MPSRTKLIIIIVLLCLQFANSQAQSFSLSGGVLDYYSRRPLEAVTVYSSSGNHTITDSAGRYSIRVSEKDSVWFTYFSKSTMKYPVDTISNTYNFEIGLYVDVAWLPELRVRNPDYRQDSIQNRADYAKVFNFKKPGVSLASNSSNASSYIPGSVTVGLDLVEFINMFRFKRNRQILSLQQRLIQQEQDKYINHRFSKLFVRQLTKLESPEIDTFMIVCRPGYYELTTWNDLELGYYIEQCYQQYIIAKDQGLIQDLLNLRNE